MSAVTICFPHQLFSGHPAFDKNRKIILVEEYLFFKQYKFHKQKIVLHRASMKNFEAQLRQKKFSVEYIEATDRNCDIRKLVPHLAATGVTTIHFCDVTDDWLRRRLKTAAKKHKVQLEEYPTENFLTSTTAAAAFFETKKTYFQTDFYIWQRKNLQVLMQKNGKPVGDKWSFDADNRKRFPAKETIHALPVLKENEFVEEAIIYTEKNFGDHYGSAAPFVYPADHATAEKWLDDFLKKRFEKFGDYEDAIVTKESFLYHSVLTPALNIGLLSPAQVLDKTLAYAAANNIPLNSLEGFVRQVMGWREFIHVVYELEGRKQRTKNYWGFTRKIPESFWNGTTGIPPIDDTIKKILKTGYCHHIERLMVLGNFMLLCEFDPNDVYRWFMELFIDSYDWVMVPNVYGMTQFADGGLMTTKPYISGSNYLMKMGDFEKGNWQAIWDGLFWRFMHVHRNFFLKNPRLGMLIKTFDKMDSSKRNQHLENAERFLQQLDQ